MFKYEKISFTFVTISFLSILILLAFSVIVNATNYYVANNGSNTAPYDTWAKAATSIQTAINFASEDDIIIIGSSDGHGTGIYSENVIVNKQLTIQSENGFSTTTIIAANSSSNVFELSEDNITISGFSIYGATGGGKAGIYLDSVNDCVIDNNRCGWDISHINSRGIYLVSTNNCSITNNITSYNSGEGILMESSSENTLTSNTASNNSMDGISLTTSSNNTFTSNTASNNSMDGFHMVPSCNNNTLNNNTASDNGQNGFLIVASSNNNLDGNTANYDATGIFLAAYSNNNTINNNTANSNDGGGINLEDHCSGNYLTSNTVTHNEFGIFMSVCSNNIISSNIMNDNDGRVDGDGIMLWGSDYNTISNNIANNDPGDGIEFYNSSHNTVIGNTLDNSGGAMRINYYSSYNTITNNTVINSSVGIIMEEESNHNFISNNTVTGHTAHGFEFWENASYNTLTRNNISNNGTFGIWLPSGSYNRIYLNDLSNNTTANIYSGSSTTTWHSPTEIYYDYNSGTFSKGYLGNYYDDGTHTGSNGISGTYTIANDNDDACQLTNTFNNYSLQAWWLNSDNNMYFNNIAKSEGTTTISNGATHIWIADQVASTAINFSGIDTWTGQLVFTTAPTNGHTFTIEIGSSTNGDNFTAGGPEAIISGNGSSTNFTFITNATAFTLTTGNYLAFRIASNSATYGVRTGGGWSYISSPDNSTDYSLPVELTTFTASVSENAVELNWETATEVNNYGFEIEKRFMESKINIQEWENIAFVEGHGNSNSHKYYSFTDNSVEAAGQYSYRLKQVDIDGTFEYSDEVEVSVGSPIEYILNQNYPNPFNPTTLISYSIPVDGNFRLSVFDVLGKEVAVIENKFISAGKYTSLFDSSHLSSGIYFYTISSNNFKITKKMLLIK